MTNPFEDETADYIVLINDEAQHSIWPVSVNVPDGWEKAFGPSRKPECLAYVDKNWTDMRPRSLVQSMNALGGNAPLADNRDNIVT